MSYLKDVSKVPELSLDVPLKINVDVDVGAVCDNRNSNDKDGLDVPLNPGKKSHFEVTVLTYVAALRIIMRLKVNYR